MKRHPATVVLASSNNGKLVELRDALSQTTFELRSQTEFGVPDAIEDGLSFIENAIIKARHCARLTGHPAIADDSGLVVPALAGAPGIYSARYSGDGDQGNNVKLLAEMQQLRGDDRAAWYMCVLVYMDSPEDPAPIIAEGRWYGTIGLAPQGDGGFGYDPLFQPAGMSGTAAELSVAEKRSRSHRGAAVRSLCEQLST